MEKTEQHSRAENSKLLTIGLQSPLHKATEEDLLCDRRTDGSINEHTEAIALSTGIFQNSHHRKTELIQKHFQNITEEGRNQLNTQDNTHNRKECTNCHRLSFGEDFIAPVVFSLPHQQHKQTNHHGHNVSPSILGNRFHQSIGIRFIVGVFYDHGQHPSKHIHHHDHCHCRIHQYIVDDQRPAHNAECTAQMFGIHSLLIQVLLILIIRIHRTHCVTTFNCSITASAVIMPSSAADIIPPA